METEKDLKQSKKISFKKLIVVAIAIVVLVAVAFIAEGIITGIKEKKALAFLDGKTFYTEYPSTKPGKRGTQKFIRFQDGQVAFENWDSFMEQVGGDISYFMECRAKTHLFDDSIAIQAKMDGKWNTLVLVALQADNTVVNYTYHESDPVWREVADEELESIRAAYSCPGHQFSNWATVSAASCSKAGEQTRTCRNCGYSETQEIARLDHKYVDKKCTVCGADQQAQKSDIEANSWYVYDNVLQIQNCVVKSATSTGGGSSMIVSYYAVCGSCHGIDERLQLAGPEVGYPVEKIHVCEWCGAKTLLKFKIG